MPPPYHPPLTIAGQTYDFPHLEPLQLVLASEKVGRPLRVHVRFTSHCFSKSYDPATYPPNTLTFSDAGGRPRVFCAERYMLSRQLPGVLVEMNHPKVKVWETVQRRNWLHR